MRELYAFELVGRAKIIGEVLAACLICNLVRQTAIRPLGAIPVSILLDDLWQVSDALQRDLLAITNIEVSDEVIVVPPVRAGPGG